MGTDVLNGLQNGELLFSPDTDAISVVVVVVVYANRHELRPAS